jgi:hypothetical protein
MNAAAAAPVQNESHLLENQVLEQLTQARSARDVDNLKQYFEQMRIARKACQIQLREGSVPASCYHVLELERSLGLHSSKYDRARLLQKLDDRCSEATSKLAIGPVALAGLSPACRRKVTAAMAIQAYRESGRGGDPESEPGGPVLEFN